MKQQTALEWYYEQTVIQGKNNFAELAEQAIAMEKVQIINACVESGTWGKDSSYSDSTLQAVKEWANGYYNETYNKNEL